jgi:hypothetical protein
LIRDGRERITLTLVSIALLSEDIAAKIKSPAA